MYTEREKRIFAETAELNARIVELVGSLCSIHGQDEPSHVEDLNMLYGQLSAMLEYKLVLDRRLLDVRTHRGSHGSIAPPPSGD